MSMTKSQEWAERIHAVLPKGCSTNSKAARYMPDEPGVIVRGKGCRVWDADGREFIDFRNSLGPVTLGYCFPATDEAIRRQMENGIIFGHPHPLEGEVAEMLCECLPCAERTRFLKTGGEAIAACIRLARYHTGRDHVVQIGYNGWINSLAAGGLVSPREIAESAPAGVPPALSALHHSARWNREETVTEIFDKLGDQIAALVVASGYDDAEAGKTFYPFLREITERHGAVLVYDEIVTGFRVALAGVQEYFGVTPDLAVFAKGLANGMPLSVYAGKAEIMEKLDRATVSSTYGGETLSLASAKAAIETYREKNVVAHLWDKGERLARGLGALFEKHGVPMECCGYLSSPRIQVQQGAPADLLERFLRGCYRNGVSFYTVAYVNFSHQDADIDETLERAERGIQEL